MPRFILTARRRDNAHPYNYYLSSSGFTTTNPEKATVLPSLAEARLEREYHNRTAPLYNFTIEQLPARKPLQTAVLSSVAVD